MKLTCCQSRPEALNHQSGSGPRTEAHHHAVTNLRNSRLRDGLLHLSLEIRHRSAAEGETVARAISSFLAKEPVSPKAADLPHCEVPAKATADQFQLGPPVSTNPEDLEWCRRQLEQ